MVTLIVFPIIFAILNYAFLKLILYFIGYYNSLVIFYDFKIFVLKSTLLEVDYIEVIDLDKITKFDTYINGIFANLIGYGTLVLEQPRDKVRELKYIPDSHRAVRILSRAKKKLEELHGINFPEPSETKI